MLLSELSIGEKIIMDETKQEQSIEFYKTSQINFVGKQYDRISNLIVNYGKAYRVEIESVELEYKKIKPTLAASENFLVNQPNGDFKLSGYINKNNLYKFDLNFKLNTQIPGDDSQIIELTISRSRWGETDILEDGVGGIQEWIIHQFKILEINPIIGG